MKKHIALTLAALLALTTAGCSSSSAPAPAETTAAETTAAETQAPETEAPTIEASETIAPEAEVPETEAPAAEGPDESAAILKEYGTYDFGEKKYSNLSFTLQSDTLEDMGDYYSVQAEFAKNVSVTPDLSDGETVTFTVNELTGETVTAVLNDNELINVNDDNDTYYYLPQEDDKEYLLTQFSDDVVTCPFYMGTLKIRKDAIHGVAIMDEYRPVTEDDLKNDPWYNGVAFDSDGFITELVFIGD